MPHSALNTTNYVQSGIRICFLVSQLAKPPPVGHHARISSWKTDHTHALIKDFGQGAQRPEKWLGEVQLTHSDNLHRKCPFCWGDVATKPVTTPNEVGGVSAKPNFVNWSHDSGLKNDFVCWFRVGRTTPPPRPACFCAPPNEHKWFGVIVVLARRSEIARANITKDTAILPTKRTQNSTTHTFPVHIPSKTWPRMVNLDETYKS